MAYATVQDLTDRFGEAELIALTDRADPPAGAVDATVAAKALDDASQLIDGYLAGRYALPLASVPSLLVTLCGDIARYRLHTDSAEGEPKARYDDAIRLLRDISGGRLTLQIAGAEPAATGGQVLHAAPERVFTAATLGGL